MRQRNYGVDMLRICSMLMIVTMHVLWQGGILRTADPSGLHYVTAWGIEIACYCAVNCYGMISGYVGVYNRLRLSRILLMWLQVVFYAVGLRLVCGALFPQTINIWEWKYGLRPIGYHFYWYYSAYFCLSLCTPVLNTALRAMRKRECQTVLIALFLALSVLTTYSKVDGFGTAKGYSTIWLIALYLLGGYFRLYSEQDSLLGWLGRFGWVTYFSSVALMWLMMVGRWWLTGGVRYLMTDETITFTYPLVVMSAVALFAKFVRLRPGLWIQKGIECLAPAVFGVYLIHVHPDIWMTLIIDKFLYLKDMPVICMVAALAATVAGVYALCTVIEWFRIRLFEFLRIGKICEWVTLSADQWINEEKKEG